MAGDGDPILQFSVVTDEFFPHGLGCYHCPQIIEVGQPFVEHFDAMDSEGTSGHLSCVYCPCSE